MCRCRPGSSRKGSPDSRLAGRAGGAGPSSRPCSRWPTPHATGWRGPRMAASWAPCRSTSAGSPKRRAEICFRGLALPERCRLAASRCGRDRCGRGRAWARPLSSAAATARLPWPRPTLAPTPATSAALPCPARMTRRGFRSRWCRHSRRRSRCNSLRAFSLLSAAICGPGRWASGRRQRRGKRPSGSNRWRSPGRSRPDLDRRWNCRSSRTTLRPPCSHSGRPLAFTDGRHRCTCMCGR